MGRDNPTACYRELGKELRATRKTAGLTASQMAKRAGWNLTKVHRMEYGEYPIKDHEVLSYLGFCGVYAPKAGDFMELWRLGQYNLGYWVNPQHENRSDAFRSLIYHETRADRSISYEPQLVPGLLQTAEYARTLIAKEPWRTPEEVDQLVRIRIERQQILHVPQPAEFAFLVHEQALRLEVGSPAIMHEQLLQLIFLAALKHVTVRVVPSGAEWLPFDRPFRLFEFDQHPPLVYLESYSAGLFLEDAGLVEPYRALVPALSEVAVD